MATKNTAATARISRITLRYVTVVHATWIPGLRLSDDTLGPKSLLNLGDSGLKIKVSTCKRVEKISNQLEALPKCSLSRHCPHFIQFVIPQRGLIARGICCFSSAKHTLPHESGPEMTGCYNTPAIPCLPPPTHIS